MTDLWESISIWLESYDGRTFDVSEEEEVLEDPNLAFVNPLAWKLTNESIIDELSDVYDVIEEHSQLIPDYLPNESKMKQMFRTKFTGIVLKSLDDIKRQLHIEPKEISDHRLLLYHVDVMYDFISMMSSETIEDILSKNMFETYNEENDDAFTELFGITRNDLTNMHTTINSVIEDADALEEEGYDAI